MNSVSQVLCIPGWGAKAGIKSDTMRGLAKSLKTLLHDDNFDVLPFDWRSGGTFSTAQFAARNAGEDLHRWISEREMKRAAYHLIAYSLGAQVVVHALDCQNHGLLQYCRGIYFLGAAIPCHSRINQNAIPPDVGYNFFSPCLDWVLAVDYRLTQGQDAAGKVGLTQGGKIRNEQADRTHCWFGADWSWAGMARRIAQLIRQNPEQR